MDERTTNENPFRPLVCHKIIRGNLKKGKNERCCGADAMRYFVTGTKISSVQIPFAVTAWLCPKHRDEAVSQGYKLQTILHSDGPSKL